MVTGIPHFNCEGSVGGLTVACRLLGLQSESRTTHVAAARREVMARLRSVTGKRQPIAKGRNSVTDKWLTRGEADQSPDEGRMIQRVDHPGLVLITGAETSGRLGLIEVAARRGTEPPRHVHHWEDEIVYLLEGALVFSLDGEEIRCAEGNCLVLPAGREHTYRVESEEVRLLVMVVPAGLERLYQELGQLSAGGGPIVEQLIAAAARYGVEITGPPPGEDVVPRI